MANGRLRAGAPDEEAKKDPGMRVSVTTAIPRIPRRCGDYSFVQNVQPFIEIVYKDGSRNRMEVAAWHLDNSDPYPCRNCVFAHDANDSPGVLVGAFEGIIRTIEIRHEFRTFYLFNPARGRRYTLEVGRWTWIAQARNRTPEQGQGRLTLDAGISRVIPALGHSQSSTESPVTSPQAMDIPFATDPRFGSSPETLAAQHLPILNGSRVIKPPGRQCGAMPPERC